MISSHIFSRKIFFQKYKTVYLVQTYMQVSQRHRAMEILKFGLAWVSLVRMDASRRGNKTDSTLILHFFVDVKLNVC